MNYLRFKKKLIPLLSFFLIALVSVMWVSYERLRTPLLTKQSASLIIKIEPSMSASQLASLLKKKRLIQSTRFFLFLVRYQGLAHQLKAGVYEVRPGETTLSFVERVASGDVITRNFSIIAGTTQQKIAQDLAAAEYLNYNPEDWSLVKGAYTNAEGLLLADTYQYQGGSTSRTLLQQAHSHLMAYLDSAWIGKDPNVPYENPYELLIAASIIEKETAIPEERRLISGVVVNRLRKKMPLQMDPTIIYGLGSAYTGKLSHDDVHTDTEYNSYLHRGLPPTPIAMVGKEALDAAAHPEWSDYLYFVARGDGTHQFSKTYEEQRKAIKKYQLKGKI